jgi:DNA-binding NarL/FixJ family response regulator
VAQGSPCRAGELGAADAETPTGLTGWSWLTPREDEVRTLLAQGKRDKEIAAYLKVTPNTARSYTSDVLSKLGVHCRHEVR